MSNDSPRARATSDRDEPDEWLLEAARRRGLTVPESERTPGTTAWRVLLNAGVSEEEVMRLACSVSGAEPADFSHVSPSMGRLLPTGIARQHRVVPLGVHDGALAIATSNPIDPALERDLAFAAKQRVRLHPGSPAEIVRALAVVYGAFGSRSELALSFPDLEPSPSPSVTQPPAATISRLTLSAPVVPQSPDAGAAMGTATAAPASAAPSPANLTDRLLLASCNERASEAILEPTPDDGLLVRLRIDGTVHDRFRVVDTHVAQMVGALKQRAGLDLNETKRSQEGRATFEPPTGRVGIRVSTEPLRDPVGERVIVRFYSANGLLRLSDLGFSNSELHQLGQLFGLAAGLIVVAGPMGSGKTSTLYSAARELLHLQRPVATIEDQIEQTLDGITQVQLRGSEHGSLGVALRAVMESRETMANVVVTDAALDALALEQCASRAGRAQLFVASIAAPDLAAALAHLRALHPDGAPLAASLQGIVVQRLVRRLCRACALPETESALPAQQRRLLYGLPLAGVRRPVGCPMCRATGYRGRMAIAEILPVSPALRAGLMRRAAPAELLHLARATVAPSLWDSGMHHVLAGETSLAELLDTVSPPESSDEAPQQDIDALLAQLLGPSTRRRGPG